MGRYIPNLIRNGRICLICLLQKREIRSNKKFWLLFYYDGIGQFSLILLNFLQLIEWKWATRSLTHLLHQTSFVRQKLISLALRMRKTEVRKIRMKEKRVLFSAVATETSSKKYVSDEKVGKICGENCYEHERYASFQDRFFFFFFEAMKSFYWKLNVSKRRFKGGSI